MAHKRKPPAGGTARDLENVASQADEYQITSNPAEIQQNRIRELVDVSDSVAALYAALAFGVPETWRHA